jgi:DNA repair protein RadC
MMDLAPSERPRQRLAEVGSRALSDSELLAVLLSTGRCGRNVVQLAEQVLVDAGGLFAESEMDIDGLMAMPGLGQTKAAALTAAVELGRQMAEKYHRGDIYRLNAE